VVDRATGGIGITHVPLLLRRGSVGSQVILHKPVDFQRCDPGRDDAGQLPVTGSEQASGSMHLLDFPFALQGNGQVPIPLSSVSIIHFYGRERKGMAGNFWAALDPPFFCARSAAAPPDKAGCTGGIPLFRSS